MAIEQPVSDGLVPRSVRPRARPWALPIGVWLALASGAILVVVLIGNRLAQKSTHTATQYVSSVEQRFGPLAQLARQLGDAVAAFDRAVFAYLKFDTADSAGALEGTAQTLLNALAENQRAGGPVPAASPDLAADIAALHREGLVLVEQQRRQRAAIKEYWSHANRLRDRVERAGAIGVQVGENMLARKSLADLGVAAERMRNLAAAQFSQREASAVEAAARADATFRKLLQNHAEELGRSPGIAWLELVREDALLAGRLRAAVAKLDGELDATRRSFGANVERVHGRVYTELQEPAWRALTQSARSARVTAQEAEGLIGLVSLAALIVIMLVSAATALGVTLPVRRLMDGTRKLASGALATRVPRGGMRELDELAASFNHMAEQLAESEQVVRSYQARLEDRVAQRTRQLRHLAHHDPLTELPNRRQLFSYLNAAIGQAVEDERRLAVLFIDVDNFKTLNDSLGHDFGDRVLRAMSRRLRELAGPSHFVARLGGDEFTIVLTNPASTMEVEERVAKLIAEFQRPLEVEQRELLVGISIGFAMCPEHATDAQSLLRAADSALFHAKELGRNRYAIHSPDLLAAATSRFRTEQALRRAIDAGELQIHYQPEVSLATLETTVVEALLRWRQPDGTVMPAAQFLAVAEQSGLILDINDWVLARVAETIAEWRCKQWPQARIAVNASAQQFLTGNFVTTIERLLARSGLEPECLEIELTETVLQTGPTTIDALHNLRMLGVSVALDDFGAGYSSLTSLEQLPLTRVKLDRGLVADVDVSPRAAAIARSIMTLCRSLGLQVTAEGVERLGQLQFLAGCGDLTVQGYLLARPAPGAETLQFVADTHGRLAALRSIPAIAHAKAPPRDGPGTVSVLRPRPRRR
ncbi:MAG TPA: EAL domain-containing protein [Steroidobacteraceae bacterium]|nr:EAL domain-containing protein [Steroidobacteraceae bacterium]